MPDASSGPPARGVGTFVSGLRVAATWWIAVGWLAGALLMHTRPTLPARPLVMGAIAAGLSGLMLLLLVGRRAHGSWARGPLCLVSVFALSVGLNAHEARQALERRIDPAAGGPRWTFTGWVERMPLRHERGARIIVRVIDCAAAARADGCRPGLGLRLGWYGAPNLEPGQVWSLQARVRAPHAPINPALFDAELRALEEGIDGLGTVRTGVRSDPAREAQVWWDLPWSTRLRGAVEGWRTRLRERLRAALPAMAAGLGEADARTGATRAEGVEGVAGAAIEGVILGLAIGDQAALSSLWWERLNRLGVGHLLSISGAHVTAFAAVIGLALARLWQWRGLAWMIRRLTGRVPAAWISRPRLIGVTACIAAFGYAGLAGWGIPAQRTCWMLAVGALALACSRTRRLAVVWLLAACAVALADPWAVLSPGFWLSFGAVAVIVIATRRQLADPGRRRGWRDVLRAQMAVTLLMIPLGALFFASGAWLGPLSNLVAIPFVTLLLTPLSLLGTALVALPAPGDLLARPVLAVAAALTRGGLQAAAWLDASAGSAWVLGRPHGIVASLALLAAVGLVVPWPVRGRVLLGLAMLPVMLGQAAHPPAQTLWVQVIDVGQGMAVLIEGQRSDGGRHRAFRLLYDTGPAYGPDGADAGNRFILPWLRARGIDRLDALIISHGDADHAGGALSVLAGLQVDRVYSSLPAGHPILSAAGARHRPCLAETGRDAGDGPALPTGVGRSAALPGSDPGSNTGSDPAADAGSDTAAEAAGIRLEWLDASPAGLVGRRASGRRSRNAASCVLRLSSPAGVILLPGDIAVREETALLARHGPDRLRADLLIAPHHGSAGSSSAAFIDAVRAEDVVFQVGHRNRYGHPRHEVIGRYRRACARLWRTDADGALSLRLQGGQVDAVSRARLDLPRYWRVPTSRERADLEDGVEGEPEGGGRGAGCLTRPLVAQEAVGAAAKMPDQSAPGSAPDPTPESAANDEPDEASAR